MSYVTHNSKRVWLGHERLIRTDDTDVQKGVLRQNLIAGPAG